MRTSAFIDVIAKNRRVSTAKLYGNLKSNGITVISQEETAAHESTLRVENIRLVRLTRDGARVRRILYRRALISFRTDVFQFFFFFFTAR